MAEEQKLTKEEVLKKIKARNEAYRLVNKERYKNEDAFWDKIEKIQTNTNK